MSLSCDGGRGYSLQSPLPWGLPSSLREFVYMRRDASSRAFSRWRMRCAFPIRLCDHPGLVEGSIFSRPGVLLTGPSEIFCECQVKATESHLTTAQFWAINEFTYSVLSTSGVPCRIVPREKRSARTVSHGLEGHEKWSPHLISSCKYVSNYLSLSDEDKLQIVLNFKPLWKKDNENVACETIYAFVKNTYQSAQGLNFSTSVT